MTTVELNASRPAQIFYTLGGENPTGPSASTYDAPIRLDNSDSALITFIAQSEDGIWSEPHAELYTPLPAPESAPKVVSRGLTVDRNNQFFTASPGDSGRVHTSFVLRSVGLRPVHLKNIYLTANSKGWGYFEDGIFQIEGPEFEEADLAPGHEKVLDVSYAPTTTLRSALLVVESDDQRSSDGVVTVELWGRILSW